ncbi:MAG: peptide ABC transporter substrate-binding protein, partial [bacterium]
RKNAKWSNGDPVTAEDFYYTFKRVLEPNTASEYVYQLFYIKNARKYYDETAAKKPYDFKQVGLKVLDPYTLQITLEYPTHYWLDLLAFQTAMPINKKCVEKYGDKWTRPENIVTNGPYSLKVWKPKDYMELVKSPTYYDAAKVRLEKITIFTIEDNISSIHMFEAGQTDWMNTIPVTYVDKAKKWPEAHITPYLGIYFYRFNVTKAPLNDKRVRMALNLAVNKADICKYVTKAGQTPATTFVPQIMPKYPQIKGQEYNPEKARALLREAGYIVNVK